MREAARTRREQGSHEATRLESLGRLLPGIAHEINSPTQYLNDYLHFLRGAWQDLCPLFDATRRIRDRSAAGPISPEDAAALVEAVRNADLEYFLEEVPKAIDQSIEGVERVAQIVRAMADFARDDDPGKTPLDVNQLILNVLTVARNQLKYVAEVTSDLDPVLPPVSGFAGELRLALLQLLINAGEAIARAQVDEIDALGRIVVRTRRVDDAVEISIADTGAGIPEDVRSWIRDQSFVTTSDGRIPGGGLPLARHVIVERHGGMLGLETEIDQGTEFVIRLPLTGP